MVSRVASGLVVDGAYENSVAWARRAELPCPSPCPAIFANHSKAPNIAVQHWPGCDGAPTSCTSCQKNTSGGKCDTPSFLLRSPRVLWRGSLASRQRPCAAPHATRRLANNTAAMPPAPQRQQQHTAAYASCSNSAHSAATHCSQHADATGRQPAAPPRPPSHAATQAQQHARAHQQSAAAQQIHAANSISTSHCSSHCSPRVL